MKKLELLLLLLFFVQSSKAQEFITLWDLGKPGGLPTVLSFGIVTSGPVHYAWDALSIGASGSGTLNGSIATITGLPSGAVIRLRIDSINFEQIKINNGICSQRLVDIEQWGSINWTSMENAFVGCSNLNISATDVPDLSNVTSLQSMFKYCTSLHSPSNIDTWNTSNVSNMSCMFCAASEFNQPIGNWDVGNVSDMSLMFHQASQFNQPLNTWNVSNVINMSQMFSFDTTFNQPINNWNTGNVVSMAVMFAVAKAFNQPLNNWNTANVTNMMGMFAGDFMFNQDLSNWNTANVTSMEGMFAEATSFNQSLNTWNTNAVVNLNGMFDHAISFNQSLSNWNTSNVTGMNFMFYEATSFNQSLANWDLSSIQFIQHALSYSGMSCENYSATIKGWALNPNTPNGKSLGAANLQYGANVLSYRNILSITKGWTISGDTQSLVPCCLIDSVSLTANVCNSYLFAGQTFTSTGVYYDTLSSIYGCDSIVTLHLFIGASNNTNINDTACSNYIFNGQILNASGMYYDTLINSLGCDSILALDLVITTSSTSIINDTACSNYIFNGQTLTANGIYYDTLINSLGCDSIITLNLVLNQSDSLLNIHACHSYFFDGQTLTVSGVYYQTLINAIGCDSVITLNLTIATPFSASFTKVGATLTANATGLVTYQWILCNPLNIIPGATNQTYIATANGDYAVIITLNTCDDTSNCKTVSTVGVDDIALPILQVYPNPTSNNFIITTSVNLQNASLKLYNSLGQIIWTKENINGNTTHVDMAKFSEGIYLVQLQQGKQKYSVKVIK